VFDDIQVYSYIIIFMIIYYTTEMYCPNVKTVLRGRSQMTIWRMDTNAINRHSKYANIYCSSTAIMAAGTRLTITSYVLACLVIYQVFQSSSTHLNSATRHVPRDLFHR
jgi:hypothetical protein